MNDDPYREFEDALTDVLTETAYSLSRRTRLANARAAVDQNDPRYIEAVNRAFLMNSQPRAEADGMTKATPVQPRAPRKPHQDRILHGNDNDQAVETTELFSEG